MKFCGNAVSAEFWANTSLFYFKKYFFQGRLKVFYSCHMSLECFLINQVQLTIPMISMFLCSCARKEKQKAKKNVQMAIFWIFSTLEISVRYTLYINILTLVVLWRYFLSKIVYESSFLQITKSQPDYLSYIKEVLYKKKQQQSRFCRKKTHSNCSFVSLKWFRKVHVRNVFLIIDDKILWLLLNL